MLYWSWCISLPHLRICLQHLSFQFNKVTSSPLTWRLVQPSQYWQPLLHTLSVSHPSWRDEHSVKQQHTQMHIMSSLSIIDKVNTVSVTDNIWSNYHIVYYISHFVIAHINIEWVCCNLLTTENDRSLLQLYIIHSLHTSLKKMCAEMTTYQVQGFCEQVLIKFSIHLHSI